MNKKEFDNILNECMERVLLRGESLEQCLERYPEQAAELKPLLETALEAREAASIKPSADFRARARYQFHSALEEAAVVKSRTSWGWFPRWATVMVIVLVLVLAGGGTVAAAESSMPDSPLYSVKLVTEQVRLTLTTSQMDKARLCAELADRRVAEIAYMAEKGDARRVEEITNRLDDNLKLMVVLIEGRGGTGLPGMLGAPGPEAAAPPTQTKPPATTVAPTETPITDAASPEAALSPGPSKASDDATSNGGRTHLKNTLLSDSARNQTVLRQALDKVPESTREALLRALDVSEIGYEEAIDALRR